MRSPFNVAVVAFRQPDVTKSKLNEPEFLILKRGDEQYWQVIAGGGEDPENAAEAARRESNQELTLSLDSKFTRLDVSANVSVRHIDRKLWPADKLAFPQHYFALDVGTTEVHLGGEENSTYKWVSYEEAQALLKWDSDRDALWEVRHRLGYS